MPRAHTKAQTKGHESGCHALQTITSPRSRHFPSSSSVQNDYASTFNKSALTTTSMSDRISATDGTASTTAYLRNDQTASILHLEQNYTTNECSKHDHSSGQGANHIFNNASKQNDGNNSSASANANIHKNEYSLIDHVGECPSHIPTTSSKVADGNKYHPKGKSSNESSFKHESMGTADTLREFASAALALSLKNGHSSYSADPSLSQKYISSSSSSSFVKNSSMPSTSFPSPQQHGNVPNTEFGREHKQQPEINSVLTSFTTSVNQGTASGAAASVPNSEDPNFAQTSHVAGSTFNNYHKQHQQPTSSSPLHHHHQSNKDDNNTLVLSSAIASSYISNGCVQQQPPTCIMRKISIGSDYSIAADVSSSCDGAVDWAKQDSTYRKRKDKKKDKSRLRKGKWTPEEEEFTKRIIHHFSTGQLILPEGTTLRSYLAEKLTCDPMRITKKFAGASCLGKRVYHICDRSKTTSNDVEMAKAELATLEHRFRLRTEHGLNGVPLLHRVTAEGMYNSRSYMLNAAVVGSVSGGPGAHNLNDSRGGMRPVSAPCVSSMSVSHDAMMQQSQFASINASAVASATMTNSNNSALHSINPTIFLAQQSSHQQHPLAQLSQNHAIAAAGLLPPMLLQGSSSQLILNMILAMNQNNLSTGNNSPVQEYTHSTIPPSPLPSNPWFPLTPTSTPVSNLFPPHVSQLAASIQYGQHLSSSPGNNCSVGQASVPHSVAPFNAVVAAASIPGFQQMQQSHQHAIAAAALAAAAAARAQEERRTTDTIHHDTSDAAIGEILQSCSNDPQSQPHKQESKLPIWNHEKTSETNNHTSAPCSAEIDQNVTRSEEDQAAGQTLIEILSTLRKRHADAMEKVKLEEQKEIDEAESSKVNSNTSSRITAKSNDNITSPPQADVASIYGSSKNHVENNSSKPTLQKALIKKQQKQQRDLLSPIFSQNSNPAVVTVASSRYDNNSNILNDNINNHPLSIGQNSSIIITCSDISSESASSLSQHIHKNNGNNSGSNKTDLSSSGDNLIPDPSSSSTSGCGSGVGSSDDDDNSDKIVCESPLKISQIKQHAGNNHNHENQNHLNKTKRNTSTHTAAHHHKRFMSEWKHKHYGEFTKRNVADHTTRMDAIQASHQSQEQQNSQHKIGSDIPSQMHDPKPQWKSSLSTIGSASCRNHSLNKRKTSSQITVGENNALERKSLIKQQQEQSHQQHNNQGFPKRVKMMISSGDR